MLKARIDWLLERGADKTTPVVYEGSVGDEAGQSASCQALNRILEFAGLAGEPGIKPRSIPAAYARQIWERTRDIGAVANSLGCRSLDAAAALVGWDWQQDADANSAPAGGFALEESTRDDSDGPTRTLYKRNPRGRAPLGRA